MRLAVILRTLSVFALVAILPACGGHATSVGPLGASTEYATVTSAAVAVSDIESYGIHLQNPTSRPLVIDRVVMVGERGRVIVAGVGIVHHPNTGIGAMPGYPPSALKGSTVYRPSGWRVAPEERNDELLVALRMPTPGLASIEKVGVVYHDEQEHYRIDLPTTLEICSPVVRWHHCPRLRFPA